MFYTMEVVVMATDTIKIVLHIDEELEIVSAKVIDHQIYLRIKIDNQVETIQFCKPCVRKPKIPTSIVEKVFSLCFG